MARRASMGPGVRARPIAAAALAPETGEAIQEASPYGPWAVAGRAKALPQPARCAYESGPTGFDLRRRLAGAGVERRAGAASKTPRPSGGRVKTDRRGAAFPAGTLAVGNVAEVAAPTEAMEAARDLARAREGRRRDLTRQRHLLSRFPPRKGVAHDAGKGARAKAHRAWLASLGPGGPCGRLVSGECLEGVKPLELRRDRLDGATPGRASRPDLAAAASAPRCLRGVSTATALPAAVEIGGLPRFGGARPFTPYVGPVPSGPSGGETVSRGGVTRAGNGRVRTPPVESAWRRAGACSPLPTTASADAAGVPAAVAEAAARANGRLRERCPRLGGRGRPADVAVAREPAGFVWATAIPTAWAGAASGVAPAPMARGAAREAAMRSHAATRDARRAELPSRGIGMRCPTRGCQTRSRASNQTRQKRPRPPGWPWRGRPASRILGPGLPSPLDKTIYISGAGRWRRRWE